MWPTLYGAHRPSGGGKARIGPADPHPGATRRHHGNLVASHYGQPWWRRSSERPYRLTPQPHQPTHVNQAVSGEGGSVGGGCVNETRLCPSRGRRLGCGPLGATSRHDVQPCRRPGTDRLHGHAPPAPRAVTIATWRPVGREGAREEVGRSGSPTRPPNRTSYDQASPADRGRERERKPTPPRPPFIQQPSEMLVV